MVLLTATPTQMKAKAGFFWFFEVDTEYFLFRTGYLNYIKYKDHTEFKVDFVELVGFFCCWGFFVVLLFFACFCFLWGVCVFAVNKNLKGSALTGWKTLWDCRWVGEEILPLIFALFLFKAPSWNSASWDVNAFYYSRFSHLCFPCQFSGCSLENEHSSNNWQLSSSETV